MDKVSLFAQQSYLPYQQDESILHWHSIVKQKFKDCGDQDSWQIFDQTTREATFFDWRMRAIIKAVIVVFLIFDFFISELRPTI